MKIEEKEKGATPLKMPPAVIARALLGKTVEPGPKADSDLVDLLKLIDQLLDGDATAFFPNDAAVDAWLSKHRWPDGVKCPHCGSSDVNDSAKHPGIPNAKRCRNKRCRRFFSVRTGTPLERSKLGLQLWGAVIVNAALGWAIDRTLPISRSTAKRLSEKMIERVAVIDAEIEQKGST